jgi:glutamate racemase
VLERPRPPQRILLGCTHFPLLLPAIRRFVPPSIEVLNQAEIVSARFADWLRRHPDFEGRLSRSGTRRYTTTDDPVWFAQRGERLLGRPMSAERVRLKAKG